MASKAKYKHLKNTWYGSWKVTYDGLSCRSPDYYIHKRQLLDDDWEIQMESKTWVVMSDFRNALQAARKYHFGDIEEVSPVSENQPDLGEKKDPPKQLPLMQAFRSDTCFCLLINFMFDHIPNVKLNLTDVPEVDADWSEIIAFALTYDGYQFWGDFKKCAEIANQAKKVYTEEGRLPNTLTELRTCQFFEQQRWCYFGRIPDEKSMVYINALIQGTREKLTNGLLE